jgi:hypothetical protein
MAQTAQPALRRLLILNVISREGPAWSAGAFGFFPSNVRMFGGDAPDDDDDPGPDPNCDYADEPRRFAGDPCRDFLCEEPRLAS